MKRLIVIALMLMSGVVQSAQDVETRYQPSDRFPLPEGLEPAVNFWIDIYTKYHTNEYIMHDDRDLSRVYEIVKLGDLHADQIDLPQTREQRRLLKRKRQYYRSILLKLASSRTDLSKLSADEQRVYDLFGGTTNRRTFRSAAYNVRAQRGQRDRFYRGLKISNKYLGSIRRVFREYGLPEELTVLPHVESSFNYKAYSTAGAAGIWQITRPTGRRLLKISYEIDERLDPILATEAAAKLLKNKRETLGNWPLAITAYNHGLAGMRRAKRKLKTSNLALIVEKYRSRSFGFASRNFYCEFLAALHVVRNHQDYFGTVDFDTQIKYQEFELPYYTKLNTIMEYFELSLEEFRDYNPALRNPIFKGSKYLPKKYRLRLPIEIDAAERFAFIPEGELFVGQKESKYYRVRRGDTLGGIARRFRTSIFALASANNIADAHTIRIGEVLHIPQEGKLASLATLNKPTKTEVAKVVEKPKKAAPPPPVEIASVPTDTHIQETTTESGPATPEVDLTPAPIRTNIEHELVLIDGTDPQIGEIRAEPEETIGHYAEWLRVSTQKIREWNNMDFGDVIHLGSKMRIQFERVEPDQFINARLEFHRGLEEDFFSNFKVVGTSTHEVKRGENIWYLCNQLYKLPLWLIRSYNNDLDFDRLNPGDLILIPEITAIETIESPNGEAVSSFDKASNESK